jgi:hypothetical protein
MSLTLALVIAGVVLLAAVAAQSLWAARRAEPRQAVAVATPAERVEPGLDTAMEVPPDSVTAETIAGLPTDFELPPSMRQPPRRGPRLDALIDILAPLTLESPIAGEAVIAHLPASRRAGSKPFAIEGLNTETGEWEPPTPGQRYGELQAGVQMASRAGALNEIEYSEFAQKVQDFAEAIGAMPELPDMLDAVGRARELDSFAQAHDAQLAVTLRANSVAWSVGYIQQCAARHGFVPGAMAGRLILPGVEDGAPPVLSLAFDAQAALAEDPNISAVRECTLWLDAPATPESAEPFPAWQQAARGLADDMDATPVDDQGQPVTLQAFATIALELKKLYAALEARDLAAGSAAARRLFS